MKNNFITYIQSFFKKKKEENPYENRIGLMNKNVYCQIEWSKENNRNIFLYGINDADKRKEYCGNLAQAQMYHTLGGPSKGIYIPRILYSVDWDFILLKNLRLRKLTITFRNYFNSVKQYSVLLEAVNDKGKVIKDCFSSTNKVFIDAYELTDNISKFIKYSEEY